MHTDDTRLRRALSSLSARTCVAVGLAVVAASACGSSGASEIPPPAAGTPAALVQGGEGPTRVLLVTGGHAFERDPFFEMFDSFGAEITYTHVQPPAAHAFFDPIRAAKYDVFVMYDWSVGPPSPELKKNFQTLLQNGKGFVFLHHALASFVRNWPEYTEVMGSACDNRPNTARGIEQPRGGFFLDAPQHITVVDTEHPVTQGVGDSYDIVDEVYVCAFFEDTAHPLLRTDFNVKEAEKYLNPRTPYTNMVGWVKTAESSPIVSLQGGHAPEAWNNPAFRRILLNAIQWTASAEALSWAKANRTQIFK